MSNQEKNLEILQNIRNRVLSEVESHFNYLIETIKQNSNAHLVINELKREKFLIELGKYISVFNYENFTPIVPHKFNNVFEDITKTIGNTPLVRLNNIAKEENLFGTVLLKLEFFNPLNSVKDRIGVQMINDALLNPKVNQDTTFIEPTSGNTGIGLAFVAAAKKLKLILVLPEHMSDERKKLFKLLGAQLVLTPKAGGMKAAIAKASELQLKIPNSIILQQFENPSNPQIHRLTTAEEIWSDTNGQVDYLVSGVGTGGTITGIGEVLKSRKKGFRIVAVEPKGSPVLSGGNPGPHVIQGIGAGFVPKILNTNIYDEIMQAPDQEAITYMKRVISSEGIPIGLSSGAIIWAAIQLAKREECKGKLIVAIVPSQTERYMSVDALKDEKLLQSDEQEILQQIILKQ